MTTTQNLKTTRFLLQALSESDRECYIKLYTDPDVMTHVTHALTPSQASQSFNNTLSSLKRKPWKTMAWSIKSMDEKKHLGITALSRSDINIESAEIGTMIKPKYQSQKVAHEVMKCTINFGFMELGLNTIYAYYSKQNHGANQLVKNLGFIIQEPEDSHPYINDPYYCFLSSNQFRNT